MDTSIWKSTGTSIARAALTVLLAIVTPLLEKNPLKALATSPSGSSPVFSMSRLVVVAFACAMLRQVWRTGVTGWPDATLSIAIVLALPLLGAIDRVRPEQVLALGSALIGRFGIGEARAPAWLYDGQPARLDQHR